MRTLTLLAALVCACYGETTDRHAVDGDHADDRLVLEGDEVSALLGDSGVTAPIHAPSGFRRLGFLWDALVDDAFEVRTSVDGLVWTDWRVPEVVAAEQPSYAGHVDAIAGIGPEGTASTDPRASWYQLRVSGDRPLPTFMIVEPIVDIPALVVSDVKLPDSEPVGTLEATVRTTPIGSVTIHSRAEWNARNPICETDPQTPTRATIHHTAGPTNDTLSVQARLRQIQAFHMFSRGWCDIGYNYLISRDGRVWTGRGARIEGAHVLDENENNVGVSFIGTYTTNIPTETQLCSGAKLLRLVHEDFPAVQLNRTDVKGHRQLGSTTCPGSALYTRIDKILRKAQSGCSVN